MPREKAGGTGLPLELEFQEVVSCLTSVLGAKLWSSARAGSALSH